MMENFVQGLKTFSPKQGITVVVDERKGSGVVDLFVALKGGMWDSASSNPALPFLFSELLEEGTASMNRDDIRRTIENVGSDLSFDLAGEYVLGKLRSTARGFPQSFRVLTEILTRPSFPEESVLVTKKRLINECREENEDTRKRAMTALSGLLFKEGSVHHLHSVEKRIELLQELRRSHLFEYAETALKRPLIISIVGDITAREVESLCAQLFLEESVREDFSPTHVKPEPNSANEIFVPVPGKENVDVFLGSYTGVSVSDDEYVPLSVAVEMLGGSGFTGHLMQTVRERDGLTYGIYARLKDVSGESPLLAFVWATFGNSLFEKGIKATKDEMRKWLEEGITHQALEKKKTEIIGSYVVSLEDPERVALKLLSLLTSGRPLSFLKGYPEAVSGLTLEALQQTARKHLAVENFKSAAAGSLKT
jgi:zinc protease